MPTGAHDAALVGDELTTLTINYEWRRFVGYALLSSFARWRADLSGSEQDTFDPLFNAFIDDFYSPGGDSMADLYLKLRRNTTQAITGGVETVLVWNDEAADFGDMYDISAPDGIITAPLTIGSAGLFLVTVSVHLGTTGGNNLRSVRLYIADKLLEVDRDTGGGQTYHSLSKLLYLGVGDSCSVTVECGANINVLGVSDPDFTTELKMIRLRPGNLG